MVIEPPGTLSVLMSDVLGEVAATSVPIPEAMALPLGSVARRETVPVGAAHELPLLHFTETWTLTGLP